MATTQLTQQTPRYQMFVGGRWVDASGEQPYNRVNPANRDDIAGVYPLASAEDVRPACHFARDTFDQGVWATYWEENRWS